MDDLRCIHLGDELVPFPLVGSGFQRRKIIRVLSCLGLRINDFGYASPVNYSLASFSVSSADVRESPVFVHGLHHKLLQCHACRQGPVHPPPATVETDFVLIPQVNVFHGDLRKGNTKRAMECGE